MNKRPDLDWRAAGELMLVSLPLWGGGLLVVVLGRSMGHSLGLVLAVANLPLALCSAVRLSLAIPVRVAVFVWSCVLVMNEASRAGLFS